MASSHVASQLKTSFEAKTPLSLKKLRTAKIGFSARRAGFSPLMMAESWNKTVLGFWIVQELALRHKAGRTGRRAVGLSYQEWGFYGFCLHFSRLGKLHTGSFLAPLGPLSPCPSPVTGRPIGLRLARPRNGRGGRLGTRFMIRLIFPSMAFS